MDKDFTASMALVTYKGKLLLILRDNIPTIRDPNHWHLVGGKRELEETPEETVKRETFEEIGIYPTQITHLFKREDKPIHVFHIELTDEEANKAHLVQEGQDLRYFPKEELTPNLLVTGTLRLLMTEKREILNKLLI